MGIAALTTGCATKKFVLSKLNPLDHRVSDLETVTGDAKQDIEENAKTASRSEEIAKTADRKAEEAGQSANRAQGSADAASQAAGAANTLAADNQHALEALDRVVAGLDSFELATTATVHFASGSSRLAEDAKTALDDAVAKAPTDRPYVIEIQGFADSTGSAALNLALSVRRADAVVRYLTTAHGIPLRRIHTLGMGSENPTADNKTRDGRAENRRVEIKLYSLKETQSTARLDQ
jgi:outer membrane protein OmpA-like peptidoglycan-associated protein